MKPTNANGHRPGLDVVRGVAVWMVFFHHFAVLRQRETWILGDATYTLASRCSLGVNLFFVLSGFLITSILIRHKSGPQMLRNFWARRILRIFPLYFGFLAIWFVITLAVSAFTGHTELYEAYQRRAPFLLSFTTNWFISQQVHFAPADQYTNHLWSLAVEEQFYIVWPLVVLALSTATLRWVSLLLFALISVARIADSSISLWPQDASTWVAVDGLALGAFTATWIERGRLPSHVVRWLGVTAALGFGLWLGMQVADARNRWSLESYGLSIVTFNVAACLFVCLAYRWQTTHPLCSRLKFLQTSGKYCYGMYLLHQPIFLAVAALAAAWSPSQPILNNLIFLSLTTPLTALAVWLAWRYLELPCLELKRWFNYGAATRVETTPE